MALLQVIKWDDPGSEIVWRFPETELTTMSQLIVNESQTAVVFKGGQRCDVFGAGRHSLSTQNIPLLNKLINLPFGGKSPFSAEVWFVNRTVPLNLKFGTPTPLQVEDPVYQVVVPVRAFGQFGLQIEDPTLFIQKIVGANSRFDQSSLVEHFKGILVSRLRSKIAQIVIQQKVGVLEIETMLDEISRQLETDYAPDYADYGLGIRAFRVMSISVPEDDPTVVELKRAKVAAARRKIEGTNYAQERQLDILETSASNEGAGGAFSSIGAGLGMGQVIGQIGQQALNQGQFSPPSPFGAQTRPPEIQFHILVNGQQTGPYGLDILSQGVQSHQFTPQSLAWRPGMPAWSAAGDIPELTALFTHSTPPPPPPANSSGS